jgi:uncharacterized protein (DUF885 family)
MSEIELVERSETIAKVVEEFLKGDVSPLSIAKKLNMSRVEVQEALNEWKAIVANNSTVHERAREALAAADQHYAMLIKEAWQTIDDADGAGDLRTKTTAIKLVSDIESKRIEMLQKAGFLENNEMASLIAETEEKQEVLASILREVVADCEKCRVEVRKRLSDYTSKPEIIEIYNNGE